MMRQTTPSLYTITLLILLTTTNLCARITTFHPIHSQSFNIARELVGSEYHRNLTASQKTHLSFSITSEFTRSFKPKRIVQTLFGDDTTKCNNTITISGSRIEGRKSTDWLADYFGLPTDFKSKVQFQPRVENALIEFMLYLGLDELADGLYLQVKIPVVRTKWDLKMIEKIKQPGTQGYESGYYNINGMSQAKLLGWFTNFISGKSVPQKNDVTFEHLRYAKMCPDSKKLTEISDIHASLGWHFVKRDWYHFGAHLLCVIPTGNRPTGEFLFEPIAGNGHHWELGFGLTNHWQPWKNDAEEEHIRFYFQAQFTHLFSTRQRRSFDLKNKPNSRYMLAQKLETPVTQNLLGQRDSNLTEPDAQFKHVYTPVANITTMDVNVSTAIQTDVTLMFTYAQKDDTWSLGYSFWGRSSDTIKRNKCSPCAKSFPEKTWALKGDSHLFGFLGTDDPPLPAQTPVALSATQSQATIHGGKNFPASGSTTHEAQESGRKNPGIDEPQSAVAGTNNTRLVSLAGQANNSENQTNISIQPVFITEADIDWCSACTRGIAHKIFTHFTHTWFVREHVVGSIGFGAEVEFGRSHKTKPNRKPEDCLNCALSYWGAWAKGSVSFD